LRSALGGFAYDIQWSQDQSAIADERIISKLRTEGEVVAMSFLAAYDWLAVLTWKLLEIPLCKPFGHWRNPDVRCDCQTIRACYTAFTW